MGIRIGGGNDDEDEYGSPEMWYGVTPESIANHVAEQMVEIILYWMKCRRMVEMRPYKEGDCDCCERREGVEVFAPKNEVERSSPRQMNQHNFIILDLFLQMCWKHYSLRSTEQLYEGEARRKDCGDGQISGGQAKLEENAHSAWNGTCTITMGIAVVV
jgi:hypothetical protein